MKTKKNLLVVVGIIILLGAIFLFSSFSMQGKYIAELGEGEKLVDSSCINSKNTIDFDPERDFLELDEEGNPVAIYLDARAPNPVSVKVTPTCTCSSDGNCRVVIEQHNTGQTLSCVDVDAEPCSGECSLGISLG